MAKRSGRNLVSRNVSSGEIRQRFRKSRWKGRSVNEIDQPQWYSLSVAVIQRVDYKKFEVTIRIDTGQTFQHTIPLTFPGAGARHFFGAMPMVGDVCLVDWAPQESGATKTPYIVSWFVPGVVAGNDWWPIQHFSPDEQSMSPKEQIKFKGSFNRIRHKLLQMEPGNIVASSAQGSDIVLNEGVLLASRRGNEIRLRDQDQALVTRSLQQFHVMAGARIYAGMVQRDAVFLPAQMFSDGVSWDQPQQVDGDGNPLTEFDLGEDSVGVLKLTPHPVFVSSGLQFDANLDPTSILQRGLFIDSEGLDLRELGEPSVYGGKSLYRVSSVGHNSVPDPNLDTLTEYRIEVAHTSDGRLPVTEQTDGFDAERLPDNIPSNTSSLNNSQAAPFVEFVMGSVVGNDPFSQTGRTLYGKPLRAVVFEGDIRTPALLSGVGSSISKHSASLFRMTPPIGTGDDPTWWSVLKDGRVMCSVAGPGDVFCAELSFGTGFRMGSGSNENNESIRVETDGSIVLQAIGGTRQTNYGIDLTAKESAVRIFGGQSTTVGGISSRSASVGEGEGGLPAVTVESGTNMLLKAAKTLKISANLVDITNVASLSLNPNTSFSVQTGDAISHTSKTNDKTVLGRATETYAGPKDSLPTNTPIREVKFTGNPATGLVGGTVDKYSLLYGDREEVLTAGDHTTTVRVGKQTYTSEAGTWKAQAGISPVSNSVSIDPATGIKADVLVGNLVLTAKAGTASLTATSSVSIRGSSVSIQAAKIAMPGVHLPAGSVLTDGVINPITGTPFKVSGVQGVPSVTVGV